MREYSFDQIQSEINGQVEFLFQSRYTKPATSTARLVNNRTKVNSSITRQLKSIFELTVNFALLSSA